MSVRLWVGLGASWVVGGIVACGGPQPTFVDDGGAGGSGAGVSTSSSSGSCDLASCPSAPGATAVCDGNACGLMCDAGRADCDTDLSSPDTNGCEVDTNTSAAHCGSCGRQCDEGCFEGDCNGAAQVSAGWGTVCAVRRNGSVYCWGRNEYGEAGNLDTMPRYVPTKVELPMPATSVSVGGDFESGHTCAIMADTTVFCWGDPLLDGAPGNGGGQPVLVTGLVNVAKVSAGGDHTCALKDDGDLFCWGQNDDGEVGDGDTQIVGIPVQIQSDVADVSAGGDHTCSALTNGDLYCWGSEQYSQLAINGEFGPDVLVPTLVPGLDGVDEVSAGQVNTCARKDDELYCWGWDYNGGVGTALCTGSVAVPTLLSLSEPLAISARGDESGVAIRGADRTLVGWGYGLRLDEMDNSCGINPSTVTGVAQVSHGKAVTCVIFESGELFCGGDDTGGAVGDGEQPMPANRGPLTRVLFPPED